MSLSASPPATAAAGGFANLAVAEAHPPDAPQQFQHHIQGGISIYIAPELADQGMRIGVEGWWKLRHLYVDGVAIQ